ncbi:phage tail length tape measure family protein, partial [Methylobacillus sp.]|uniref:phage tail length tape measure family protein n=1 Tax=Methylobacillus sp. TaxID=56818 RepID=UPI002FE3C277
MAQDIVELGVIVSDNDSAVKVTKSLKALAEQGGKTEKALDGVGKKAKKAAQDIDSAAAGTKKTKTALKEVATESVKAEKALDGIGKKARDAKKPIFDLGEELDRAKAKLNAFVDSSAKSANINLMGVSSGFRAELNNVSSGVKGVTGELPKLTSKLDETRKRFDYNALSAKQYTAALRGVPAQLTDIFVSLQGGQAPLTVMLQQGGQLKDMFGGVGNAAKALGGYVLSLINPFTVAAAAVTGLGAAYYAGWKEGDNLNKSLISTGNILGATRAQLMGYGDAVGNLTGSYGKARDAAQAMAAAGVAFGGDIQATMQSIVEISRMTGREVENVTEDFIRLSKDPVKGIKDLNNQYHFLTDATYAQIKSLAEQGRAQDAATLAVKTYSDTVNGRTEEVRKNLGHMERAWKAVGSAASTAWDAIKRGSVYVWEFGGSKSLQELQATYDAITKRVEAAQNIRTVQNIGQLRQLLEQQAVAKKALDAANAELKKEQDAAAKQQKEDAKIKARDEADKRYAELKNSLLRDEIALRATYAQQIKDINAAEAAGNFTASEAARMRKQAADDLSGALNKGNKSIKEQAEFTAQLSQSYADLTKQIMALNAPQETQIQIIERLMGTMPHLTQAYRDWAQAQFDIAKDNEFEASLYRQQTALDDQVEAIRQQALAVRDESETLGYLPSQITKVTIARLEDRKAILEGLGLVVPEIEAQIAAYKELAEAQGGKEFRQAQIDAEKERVKAAEDAAKEIQRTHERMSENINRSLTDALLRGFESGKSFAENFKDTLRNMFKSLVLQPVVRFLVDASGISAIGTGLVSMLSGGAANAAGAGGSVGEAANLLGVGKNLYSAFTGGLDKLGSSITGSIQDLGVFLSSGNGGLADSIGGFLGQYSNQIATGLAFAPAAISLLKGDVKSAAFSGAGAALGSLLGPGGAVIGGAIGSLLGGAFGFGKKKPKRYGTSASMVYEDGAVISSSTGNIKRALGLDAGLSGLNESFSASLGGLLSAFGLSDRISSSSYMSAKTNVRGG